MNDFQAFATGASGRLLLFGCPDGLSMYKLSTTGPICRILPGPREAHNSFSVGGSVRLIAVLGETPLIAFVLDGIQSRPQDDLPAFITKSTQQPQQPQPHQPQQPQPMESVSTPTPRVLHLYDASQRQVLAALHFKTAVVGVRLNSARLAVALEASVHVFDLRTLRHVAELRTTSPRNPLGILALSDPTANAHGEPVSYLAFPQSDCGRGDVCVSQVPQPRAECAKGGRAEQVERVAVLSAHQCAVACVAMTRSGTHLATASERGTTVKVFEPATGRLLFVFRRGIMHARMLSLAFDAAGRRLAALSTRGTLHVFRCAAAEDTEAAATTAATTAATASTTAAAATAAAAVATAPGALGAAGYIGGEERSFAQAAVRRAAARECFFADDGRSVWAVLPLSAGEQRGWALHQYVINGKTCELVGAHTVRV